MSQAKHAGSGAKAPPSLSDREIATLVRLATWALHEDPNGWPPEVRALVLKAQLIYSSPA